MLGNATVFATLAVTDLGTADEFYGSVLGLEKIDQNPGGITFKSGKGKLFVYEAPSGGKNPATSAGWEVSGIEAVVASLKDNGVTFEHYDGFPVEWQGDVAVMGSMKSAWFKDPAGNTLQIGELVATS